MFVAAQVSGALEVRREDFREAAVRSREHQELYLEALRRLDGLSASELGKRIEGHEWPGAQPTCELAEKGAIVPFSHRWNTVQEARAWALDTLRGVTTVAVDGSQIAASKEYGVPVSLVQVAWFENPHDVFGTYIKDVRNEVLAGDTSEQEVQEYAFTESRLNQRRFALEMQVAIEQVRALRPSPLPVVFVDGSFVLSFIRRLPPPVQRAYLEPLFDLLDASQQHRVPVAGYVDLSHARDLTAMLRVAFDLPQSDVSDAQILRRRMEYFDRTVAFVTARGDVLPRYRGDDRGWSDGLCFVYLQIGPNRLPARLDLPRWVLDAGVLDHVVDIIRAEIVVGGGYPYALETADAAAVLTMQDRMASMQRNRTILEKLAE